jgi:hypothetical protein
MVLGFRYSDGSSGIEYTPKPIAVKIFGRIMTPRLPVARHRGSYLQVSVHIVAAISAVCLASCSSDKPTETDDLEVTSISIDTASFELERGNHKVLTATARNSKGKIVVVPFVWRSSDDSIAIFEPNGRLLARTEGTAGLVATSLGVTSPAIAVRVVWLGAAKLSSSWTAPNAASPATPLADSVRVLVSNKSGGPAPGATVIFSVTGGAGTVSPAKVTADSKGAAATRWTLGPASGPNGLTATVVDDDGNAIPWVAPNQVKFAITSFRAMTVVDGDKQTALLLSALPVHPAVKLVDSAGKPRQGVPITFVATGGGRVATPVVSTGADGVASPGVWTLGDIPGDQSLVAMVESAVVEVHATATGTPIHLMPAQVISGGFATCALLTSGSASCWGKAPLVGDGDTLNRSVPTATKGEIQFKSIGGGMTHFCGVSADRLVYCWGFNAITDTAGKPLAALKPTKISGEVAWDQVTTGLQHDCGLDVDQTPYCWGNNSLGQLGDRDTLSRAAPAPVYGGFKFVGISAGRAHTCGITVTRSAFCWGSNVSGQLGDGTIVSRVAPTAVGGGLSFVSIGAGEVWTCGLTTDGKAYCWGNIIAGPAAQTTPLAITSPPTFASLSVGGGHACGLTSDGTAYCWGANNVGQLGDSTTTSRAAPSRVVGGLKFSAISAGYAHTCGKTLDGSVACWGLNVAGELGDSTATALRLAPRFIVLGVNP